jgi:C-terminal processing protease CtpA/Prc
MPESPADVAGLQEGDELMFVNNELASSLSISNIYRSLQRGAGKEITLAVRRNGQFIVVSFALKRMI